MVDPKPLLPSSDLENPSTLPCSYVTHLPDGSNSSGPPANPRRPTKELVMVACGFLLIGFLVAVIGYGESNAHFNVDGDVTLSMLQDSSNQGTVPSELRQPISRGRPEGVSEKTNGLSVGFNVESFPWNNSMLSWQRTAYHFQPEKNWMNGPLYYKGWYHFFYQYNPEAAVWGNIVWGHAVSRDMIHWMHLPVALAPDQWYDKGGCFTGSATVLPDGQVIMLYTGVTRDKVQLQNLAVPADLNDPLLVNWVKYSGNPILAPPPGVGDTDFRDPTTAWFTSEGKWRIAIGSKLNTTGISLIYDTKDFKTYELYDGLLSAVAGTGMWECVDFYPVSTTSEIGLDTSVIRPDVKHVVKTSLDDVQTDYYTVGTYNDKKVKFEADNPEIDVGIGLRYDYGKFYASKTFYDPSKERRVLWGWIRELDSEFADIKKGWASVQAIPRTILLDRKTGTNLLQWPVEEIENLRLTSNEFENVKVNPGSVVPLDVGTATQLDIVAEFEIDKEALEKTTQSNVEFSCSESGGAAQRGALGPFGLLVLADEILSERTPVYFYITKGSNGHLKTFYCTDQTRSSVATDVTKQIFGSYVPVLKDEKLSVRVLVDHSTLESFVQGGRTCTATRVYPTKAIYGAARLFLFNNGTEASVSASVKIWQMNSAFIRPFHPEETH
ncbi:Acid beta-fructofuranosidase [Quillaja saponaria]|uniref:Acid beta-fructofuranosidase n=1 Tax=Quillaja saponaria TaxID=32244 RepID=A0AAD7L7B1_QUISA|nr:Acid beta-fructofuranosidase [Quillaja saponaria]